MWKLSFDDKQGRERGGATAASGHSVSGSHGLVNDAGGPIKLIPVDKLTPYPGNARKHSRKQNSGSGRRHRQRFTNPVLIDNDAQIIAGHGRVEAAKLLGMKSVPTLRLSHLSGADKRAYIIADNRLAELAGWDREPCRPSSCRALIDVDLTSSSPGSRRPRSTSSWRTRRRLRAKRRVPKIKYPIPSPVLRLVNLAISGYLGNHRLVCGDARNDEAYQRLMRSEKATFAFTDPPYNVRIDGHVCGGGVIRHREFAMASGEMTSEAFADFLTTVFGRLAAYTTNGSIHDVCMDWRHIDEMMTAGRAVYAELKNLCIWNRPMPVWAAFTAASTN